MAAALHPAVVVTGATGAIGSAAAREFSRRGARVISMSRREMDFSSMASVRAAAREINRAGGHIDALVHTAATFTTRFQKTADGLELMLETNHLGPFLLTNLVRDRLVDGGRVITVTAPSTTRVDMDRLLDRERFNAMHTFGATKAANLMFTFELARRAKRWDVVANAFFPGVVRSELMREAPRALGFVSRLLSRSPDKAAQDLVDLALSPAFAGTTGWFFKGTRRTDPPRPTLDIGQQSTLWKRSAELVELESGGF